MKLRGIWLRFSSRAPFDVRHDSIAVDVALYCSKLKVIIRHPAQHRSQLINLRVFSPAKRLSAHVSSGETGLRAA